MYRAPAGGRHFSGYVMKEWTPGPYFSVIPVFQHPHSDENTGIDTRVYDITIYDETGSALCFMDKLELRNSGNTNTGWGGRESSSGGWGSGGCWGSSSKNDDVTDKTKPTTQKTVDTLQFRPHRIAPGVRRVLGGAHPKMLRIRLLLGRAHRAAVGVHPVPSLTRVVGGVPPARTPTPLIQTLRFRPRRITPGVHQVPHAKGTLDSSATGWGSSGNAWGSSSWGSSNESA